MWKVSAPGAVSMSNMQDKPFRCDLPIDFRPLREALANAGYTMDAIVETLDVGRTDGAVDVEYVKRRLDAASHFGALLRLFYLGQSVPSDVAREALAPMKLGDLVESGLLQTQTGHVRATASLAPFHDVLLLNDFGFAITNRPLASDHVIAAGRASLGLAAMTPRRAVQSALDVGTGSGVHAFRLASHSRRVIATDLNPRAANFVRFAAKINEALNIEVRLGDLYEPVRDQQFDLIVANPPFVISPDATLVFRDGGRRGDEISQRTVRGLTELLAEGGFGVVAFNWAHENPDDTAQVFRQWLAGAACDVWLLKVQTQDPLLYAANWLRAAEERGGLPYADKLDSWLAYYEKLGIRHISTGVVVLRRRTAGRHWFRMDEVSGWGEVPHDCSDQVESIFAAHDFLDSLADESQLAVHAFALSPDHVILHRQRAQKGAWTTESLQLSHTRGLPFTGNIDAISAGLLARCDGRRPLNELVDGLCEQTRLDRTKVLPSACRLFASMLRAGFLSVPTLTS